MDIKKLQSIVIDALEDVKAQDIKVFDTVHLTSLFDRIAIASGTSNRQTKALAASVRDKVKEKGGTILSVEGEDTGEWVLVDLGDMIVHIMQPAIRAYYRLEEIWGEKEVKFGAAKRVAKRNAVNSDDEEAAPKKTAGRHLTVSKTVAAEGAPKKPTARKPSATATTSAAPAAKKAAARTRKSTVKEPAGKTVKVAATKSAVAASSRKKPAAASPAKRVPAKDQAAK
jgi:ribosome-associated protein